MRCPPIHGLRLDQSDITALRRLRNLPRSRKLLEATLPTGVMATIFLGNNAAQVGHNIAVTDWATLAQAMASVSAIERNAFVQTARLQQLRSGSTHEQRLFWRAVEDGCQGF